MKKLVTGLLALAAVGLLVGCGAMQATETVPADEVPVVVSETEGQVSAEAIVEPNRWSELHVDGNGVVVEVLVEEGDSVSKGALLVRVDPTDAELAIQKAEAELARAEARLAQVEAGPRPEEVAVTEARLKAMQAALAQAAARRDSLKDGEAQKEIVAAQAALAAALAEQRLAYNTHEMTMKCFEFDLPNGKKETVCPALGRPEEYARYALNTAEDRLEAAQLQLEAAQNQAEARLRDANAGVWASTAQEETVKAQLDLQKAGSISEQIASAEAEVERAKAALAAAEAALDRSLIRAPFDGTVAELHVDVGDVVFPGQAVVVIATLDQLLIKTKDLTELDVVRVKEGQPATIELDALPDATLKGHVIRIDKQAEDFRGDVVYPVIIELDEDTPRLRWGMTALAEIDVE